jgi:hypothetical protein
MEKAVEHLLNDASLDLVIKGGKRKVGCCAHDMKGGCEVVGSMREDEGASVYEAESKVEGGGCEGWRRKCEG